MLWYHFKSCNKLRVRELSKDIVMFLTLRCRTGELKRKDKYASSTSLDSLPEDGESVFLPPQLMALMKHLLHCGNHGLVAFVQEIQNRYDQKYKTETDRLI